MKKLVVLLTVVATASAFSQGTINFQNKITGSIDAPISYGDGANGAVVPQVIGTRINGSGSLVVNGLNWGGQFAQAALYGGPVGTAEGVMTLLVPAVGFRTTTATAGYVNVGSSGSRTIDTVAPGGTGVFQVRAWDAGETQVNNTFENAVLLGNSIHGAYYGASEILTIGPLGGGSPPLTAPNLVGLTGFAMQFHVVPEPSIIGLGILGAVAGLVAFRRRN